MRGEVRTQWSDGQEGQDSSRALTCSSWTWTHGRATPGTARLPHSQAPGPAWTSPSPVLGAGPAAPETHKAPRLTAAQPEGRGQDQASA